MGFFKNTINDILSQIDRLLSNDKIDKKRKDARLAQLEMDAKMQMAAMRQSSMIQDQMRNRIPSVSSRKVHTIVDSKRNKKLNKYSFSQKQQYEILDRRVRFSRGEKNVYK